MTLPDDSVEVFIIFLRSSPKAYHWLKERTWVEHPIGTVVSGCYLACMNTLLLIVVLLLLFGGGGFYFGGPVIGGGGLGLILLICLIVFLMGGFRTTKS